MGGNWKEERTPPRPPVEGCTRYERRWSCARAAEGERNGEGGRRREEREPGWREKM
jgi:hypothetical protein